MRSTILVSFVVLAAALPATAHAAGGSLTPIDSHEGDAGMAGARGLAISPDQKHVYVAAPTAGAVAWYVRETDGTLTYGGCIDDEGGPDPCSSNEAEGLASAQYVAVSPDGAHVYAAGGGADAAVVTLDRNEDTGALEPASCVEDTGSAATCPADADALNGAEGVAVSQDGDNVYVVAQSDQALTVFDRDEGSGALTEVECFAQAGANGCTSITGEIGAPRTVTVAPDDRGVYVGAANSGVVAFLRNTSDGTLDWVETTAELDPALIVGVAVSPDNENVYAGSVNRAAVYVLSRDPNTGGVDVEGCITDDGSGVDCDNEAEGLLGAEGVVVAPDGGTVYAAGMFDSAVVALSRNSDTGSLAFVECARDLPSAPGGCVSQSDGMLTTRDVTISEDGLFVYATGQNEAGIAAFSRELPVPTDDGDGEPQPPPADPPGEPAPQPGPPPGPLPVTPLPPTAEELLARRTAAQIAGAFGLPGTRKCQSRRRFGIRLREPAGVDIAGAVIRYAGRRTTARFRTGRWRATIDLRGLPKGRFRVRIEVTTTTGRKLVGSRRYRTCATKKRRGRVRPI